MNVKNKPVILGVLGIIGVMVLIPAYGQVNISEIMADYYVDLTSTVLSDYDKDQIIRHQQMLLFQKDNIIATQNIMNHELLKQMTIQLDVNVNGEEVLGTSIIVTEETNPDENNAFEICLESSYRLDYSEIICDQFR